MVYKNLFDRLFFSLFFFVIYFISINDKYILFVIGTLIYLIVLYEILKSFNNFFFKLILSYLLLSYLCFTLYFFIYYNFIIFNIFVLTIILFDSFSYFAGKIFGRKYIFKYISPKKTLEGYLGGVLFTNVSLIGLFYFIHIEITIIKLIILINLTIFTSICGDLTESFFKRKNNIKDSSKYLPGHGGFFDRFDSFIFSIMMLTVFSLL